ALSSSGFTDQKRRKILHPAVQEAHVDPQIACEQIVPETFAQPHHRATGTEQRAFDEVKRAAHLPKHFEIALTFLDGKAVLSELAEQRAREANRERPLLGRELRLDQTVELFGVTVKQ